jgi:hypothetical protein
VSAAQQDNNQKQNKKKGGGNTASPQQHVQTGPKVHGVQHQNPQGQHYRNQNKFSGQTHTTTNLNSSKSNKFNKQTNVSGNVASTKFNKSNTVNKHGTVNKNYKIQQFNVSKNGNQKYQAVKFNQNYHIAGAHNWHGSQYVAFANYHPVWHDQGWWGSHYGNHLVFILGGWYYWNANYWYPAWGYDPGAVYYFDGPVYASHPDVDPGQVVANVQSALQQEGYYQGDIDGILGPQTRAALADYQSAQGIEPTGAVDEPTLQSLGMA